MRNSASFKKSSNSRFNLDLDRVDLLLIKAALSAYSLSLKTFVKKYSLKSNTSIQAIDRCISLSRLFEDLYDQF